MKILIILRKWEDEEGVGKAVQKIKEKLQEQGHIIETISREEDLGVDSLSNSMSSLKEFVLIKNQKENYDIIYTHDWSIAFPLLFPKRILKQKHFCFFHNIQSGENSKIFQKIVGNMLGKKLIVKTEKLKKMFPKSIFCPEGIPKII